MKSRRYSTSGHDSERSRRICCIALVVFSFDCSRYRNDPFSFSITSGGTPRRISPIVFVPKIRAGRLPTVRAKGSASLVTTEYPPMNAYRPTRQN